MQQSSLLSIFCGTLLGIAPALAIPYDEYILAPSSRNLHPVSVYKVNGTVTGAQSLTGDALGSAIFNGPSAITFDYHKNIGGVVSLTVGGRVDLGQYIGVTFTESSLWISGQGSDATADAGIDETLWFQPTGPGVYTVSREHERGAFRYLSLIHNTTGSLEITQVTTYFTPMPHYADNALRDYTGWFHCDDDLINRIWYAGAYTNQLCTISPAHGNALIWLGIINSTQSLNYSVPWYNNYTISNGTSVLVDGAKRDRLVWAGDMSIAVPAIVVSTDDLISVRNSLDSLFALQDPVNGQLPYAGRPFFRIFSATYHLYTLIGVADYYIYSGDYQYLTSMWEPFKRALSYSLGTIDQTGLMNVTSSADWLRFGMGGHNIEANSILYYTINQGLALASALNDNSVTASWQSYAAGIKSAANSRLWDASAGLFRDNETTTLHPQDGNAWAVVAGVTQTAEQNAAISRNLARRWGPYGAPAIEAQDAVSPFISGFELQAHFLAGNATAAMELMRLEWGFMLNDPRQTNSTFMEGYSSTGALHYAPFTNDPRVSYAHGWATGPTSTLTFDVAGVQIVGAGGQTWRIAPSLGGLKNADAGFSTGLGLFSAKTTAGDDGSFQIDFETPVGTTGEVSVEYPACGGVMTLRAVNGDCADVTVQVQPAQNPSGRIGLAGVNGGQWEVRFSCSQ